MTPLSTLLMAGFAANLLSLGFAAEPTGFVRSLDRVAGLHALALPADARRLDVKTRHIEAWVYDDLDPAQDPTLAERARVLDTVILPAVATVVGIPVNSWPTVRVAFDQLREADRAGLMSEELWRSFDGPAITLDSRLSAGAFAAAAVHELAHALHRWKSGSPLTQAGTWLDEGMARWIEASALGSSPELEISNFFAGSDTEPLEAWPNSPSGRDYAQSLLFFSYLYAHLGRDALLGDLLKQPFGALETLAPAMRAAAARDPALSTRWLTRDALFTHFALALAINSPYLGKHQLFSLGELPGNPQELRSRTLAAPWLIVNAPGSRMMPPAALATLQARLYSIAPGECWSAVADRVDADLEAYALSGEGVTTAIDLTGGEICAEEPALKTRWLFVNRGPAIRLTLTRTR